MSAAAACPACGGALEPWTEVEAFEPADRRSFPLSRCAECGSAVTEGEPPGDEAYSAGAYAPDPPRGAAVVERMLRGSARGPVRMLRRAGVGPGARVLDAGAGRGRLVSVLRGAGYEASGIDPSGRGAGVERATIEAHEASGLDAVVLWHVVEHLSDPGGALERVRGWLGREGVALVAVPNLGSWQARVGGGAWMHLDVPRHRTHLTVPGLHSLLLRSGFKPERTSHFAWDLNPLGMWSALLSSGLRLPAGYPFHLLKRNAPAGPAHLGRLAVGLPLAPVAVAAEATAGAAGRGGTVATLARAR